ncbi:hypothetical protein [Desulfobacula phenolica]|uniref:Sulfotransferase domain-containing protein n=1 Tax=Desulfobacula phenolica TaxID=90732 RepID=A0A1H2JR25_9BACT|nr:hypothetical protein [Desulfobacula phenolica]SDU58475.1 hypothetical protein SAMN04487931_11431 [Desulfobacula phenolica]
MKPKSYQTHPVLNQDVIDLINLNLSSFSRIILAISTVRSGSTALMRVFAAVGIPSYFQEIKNTLRWKMIGINHPCTLPQIPCKDLFLKETLGPYTQTECTFNPLEILLKAGLPKDRIHLVIIGRDPLHTWASCNSLWGQNTRIELMIQAFHTVEKIRCYALQNKIPSTCLTLETFKHESSETVIRKLFWRLDIPFHIQAVKNWEKLPFFGTKGSNIFFPKEPEIFDMPQGLAVIKQSSRLNYKAGIRDISSLKKSDRNKISQNGLLEIYKLWNETCRINLSADFQNGSLYLKTAGKKTFQSTNTQPRSL